MCISRCRRVQQGYLAPSDRATTCPWKGRANYYDIVVGGEVDKDAAWTYREPSNAARDIKGFIAFWRGVQVEQ